MSKVAYANVRVYLQEDRVTYKAVASVERLIDDGGIVEKTEFSGVQAGAAEALAEALQLAGFVDKGPKT